MIKLIRTAIVLVAVVIFAACNAGAGRGAPAPQGSNAYPPQPGDTALMRGEIRVDSASIALAESYPPQVMLHIAYFPPTPCYQLRVQASQPDPQSRIDVQAYGVAPKDKACTLMALSTPLQVNMNLGSYPSGHYSVWLNGVKVGEFVS